MQVPKWALIALFVLSVTGLIIVAMRPIAQTVTRERRAVYDERARRAALAKIKPPPIPNALAEDANLAVREALDDYRSGRYEIGAAKLHDLTSRDPANADLQLLLGACYLLTNDSDLGVRELKVAVSLAPQRAEWARFLLAKAYIGRSSNAEAEIQLRQLLNLHGPLEYEARELLRGLQTLH